MLNREFDPQRAIWYDSVFNGSALSDTVEKWHEHRAINSGLSDFEYMNLLRGIIQSIFEEKVGLEEEKAELTARLMQYDTAIDKLSKL